VAPYFAFLHHLAAFTLFASLVIEFVLIKGELTLKSARMLQRADLAFGIAAGIVIIIGFLRVFYFEKGPYYYFHSMPFAIKMVAFMMVGLLSILPTMEFLSWSRSLKAGQLPAVSARKIRIIRILIHLELVGIAVIILGAALMAKGVGFSG
jgi:putative membrane protein